MDRPSTLRSWLAGPACPTGVPMLAWMTAAALIILGLAQWDEPGTATELLLLAPALAAFVLRGLVGRLYPELFAAAVIVPVAVVVGQAGHLEGAFFLPTLVTLYTAWHLGITPRSGSIIVVASLAPWLVAQHLGPAHDLGWRAWSSAAFFTSGLGLGLRQQQRIIDELHEARQALADQAVAEERRRIARELHDLAGHTLAAVLLHVTGARHVLRRDLDDADRALRDAETVGRASLDQIRATVAALRTDERGTDASLAGSAELVDLVDEYRRAGIEVEISLADGTDAIAGPLGTAVHRIARESLANVARHNPQNKVRLTAAPTDGILHLRVTDHGRPAAPAASGTGHFGLIGMHERARALGGDLHAGPTADGWAVVARLPLAVPTDGEVPRG